MILLVIISNNILLNLSITLIYYLFLLDYISNIPNLIYLLLEIGFFLLYYGNALACYYVIGKCIKPIILQEF